LQPDHPTESTRVYGVPVERSRPVQFKQALRGFQDGKNIREVSDKTGIGKDALTRIRREYADVIAEKNHRAVETMVLIRERMLGKLADQIDDLKAREIPLAAAILTDKIEQLTGGNVTRVEHVSVKLPEDVVKGDVVDLFPTNTCNDSGSDQETLMFTAPSDTSSKCCADDSGQVRGGGGLTEPPREKPDDLTPKNFSPEKSDSSSSERDVIDGDNDDLRSDSLGVAGDTRSD